MKMRSCHVERFDDLVRSERYFTATLLPLLLFHNEMEGLDRFLKLIDEERTRKCTPIGIKQNKLGETKYFYFRDAQIITEFHIARDISHAGLRIKCETERKNKNKKPKQSAPDLVIILETEVIVCEAKFFHEFDEANLNAQLEDQRSQIHYILSAKASLRGFRHVVILPKRPCFEVVSDHLITWSDILDLARDVMGPDHYVTRRFSNAIERYRRTDKEGRNWDGKLTFEEMQNKCSTLGNAIQVGNAADIRKMTMEQREKKLWKWRNPSTNKGKIIPQNWSPGSYWLEEILDKKRL